MIIAYQYRWYPNNEQKYYLAQASGCAKLVYNIGVAEVIKQNKEYHEAPIDQKPKLKAVNWQQIDKQVNELKKTEKYSFLGNAPAMALQYSIQNFGTAQKNYFDSRTGKRKGEKIGQPKFKKFDKDGVQKISFAAGGSGPVKEGDLTKSGKQKKFNAGNCYLKNGQVKIPGMSLGALNIHWHRPLPEDSRLKEVHLSKNLVGHYYISLVVETSIGPNRKPTGKAIGGDLGLEHYLITSDGLKYDLPKEKLKKLSKKQRKIQSKQSKAKNGSRRQKKYKEKNRKVFNKISNIKNNSLHKLTKKLVQENDIICIEDLAIKSMMQNKRYAAAIYQQSWGEFGRQLEYKAKNSGVKLIRVNRYFPSSQICHHCDTKNSQMKDTRLRELHCTSCGTRSDRDINAAKNILAEGLRSI